MFSLYELGNKPYKTKIHRNEEHIHVAKVWIFAGWLILDLDVSKSRHHLDLGLDLDICLRPRSRYLFDDIILQHLMTSFCLDLDNLHILLLKTCLYPSPSPSSNPSPNPSPKPSLNPSPNPSMNPSPNLSPNGKFHNRI